MKSNKRRLSEDGETRSIVNHILSGNEPTPFIDLLLAALADAGCPFNPNIHIAIEDCHQSSNILGAFDSYNNQVVLCQNNFERLPSISGKTSKMKYLLSHELIHAYDHCRANVDFYNNPEHVMCSEIRAAALSGECMFSENVLNSAFAGIKSYHQTCAKNAALASFQTLFPSWSREKSLNLVEKVFSSCYGDYSPFDRIPFTKKQAELSYLAYQTRKTYNLK